MAEWMALPMDGYEAANLALMKVGPREAKMERPAVGQKGHLKVVGWVLKWAHSTVVRSGSLTACFVAVLRADNWAHKSAENWGYHWVVLRVYCSAS
jgi:hypothetical protein